jgi:AraC family transcriptional activator FtrA
VTRRRRATTHWLYADRLARAFPLVQVDPNPLYLVDDGVHTSAGAAAGIDHCLHLVAADHGAEVAATVSRRLVMPLHRAGGQALYIDEPILGERPEAELTALLEWGRGQLSAGIVAADLARKASVSTRTLSRQFARCLGTSPARWLAQERVRYAQRLLQQTGDPIDVIARRAGYATTTTMRAQFAAALSTSPTAYRRTFLLAPRRPPSRR